MELGETFFANSGRDQCAFTRIDLLAVLLTLAVLFVVLFPALARTRVQPQGTQCINNIRQLSSAWLMYAGNNNGQCVGNNWPAEKNWSNPGNWRKNWISGWMDASGTTVGGFTTDNTNTDLLVNPQYAALGDYIKNDKVFVCPACFVLGPVNATTKLPLVRSYSMSCWVGYNCLPDGVDNSKYASGTAPTPDYSTGEAAYYKTFGKVSSIPMPSNIFVFMEEHGASIDDGSFNVDESPNIPNIPADYHNGAATIGFADGHVEAHRWLTAPCLTRQQANVTMHLTSGGFISIYNQDWQWLRDHSTVQK